MILYILKVSITLAVITAFYWMFLRKLTFYRWNRWYLLGYSLLAFGLPFLNIYDFLDPARPKLDLLQMIPAIGGGGGFQEPVVHGSFFDNLSWQQLFGGLIGIGVVVLFLRLLINVSSFLQLKRKAQLLQNGPVKIYALAESSAHFSFGNTIFINPTQHSGTELERIILHELVHVRQKHTVDILWAEFLCLLMWFNPFVWLLRRSIRQNLEFLADAEVLNQGIAPKEYQFLLLKVMGGMPHRIATPFGFSFLKKRIAMMNKNKTARIHTVRFLFVFPCLTILLLSFREMPAFNPNPPATVVETLNVNTDKPALVLVQTDTVPASRGNVKKAESEKSKGKRDTVRLEGRASGVEVKTLGETIERVVVRGTNGEGAGEPLYVVDGQPVLEKNAIAKISPNEIESITVLKDAASKALYGEAAKNGVIIVTTKQGVPGAKTNMLLLKGEKSVDTVRLGKERETVVQVRGQKKPLEEVVVTGMRSNDPIYIVDGKQYSAKEFKEMNISPDSIKSVEVLKGENAIKLYGSKGAMGVIVITSK